MGLNQKAEKKNAGGIEEAKRRIRESIRYNQPDFWLLLAIIMLLGLGTMMVFSASSASAYSLNSQSNAYTILKKQLIFAVLGVGAMLFVSMIDYKVVARFTIPFFALCIALLVLVKLIGTTHNNAKRWLNFGIEFQPSELYKIAVILFLAYVFSKPRLSYKAVRLLGILIYIVPVGIGIGLIALQPHISCVLIVGMVMVAMMFAGRVKLPTYLCMGACAVLLAVIVFATKSVNFEYIAERFTTFLDPEHDTSGDSYQIMQSLYAISSGGLFGKGFGKGVQKYLYLPEPYNDFILSILAEELGFFGVTLVLGLFALFIWRGYKIARNAPDKFSSLTAFGITTLITVQVLMNVAVVTSSMPVTGISLPFFSYGGTSLVILLASMGILLNISKQSHYEKF